MKQDLFSSPLHAAKAPAHLEHATLAKIQVSRLGLLDSIPLPRPLLDQSAGLLIAGGQARQGQQFDQTNLALRGVLQGHLVRRHIAGVLAPGENPLKFCLSLLSGA